jgi:hypothetical protein
MKMSNYYWRDQVRYTNKQGKSRHDSRGALTGQTRMEKALLLDDTSWWKF